NTGQQALVELIDKNATDTEQKQQIATLLIQRGEEDTPAALVAAAQKHPEMVNEQLIDYFVSKKYEPAIPVLKQSIENNRHPEKCIDALRNYNREELDLYILALGQDKNNAPVRLKALQTVSGIESDNIREKATPTFEQIVKDYQDEPAEVVLVAMNFLKTLPYDERRYALLREIYENTDDPALKEATLATLAELRDTSLEEMQRFLNNTMEGADVELAVISTEESPRREVPVERTQPQRRTTRVDETPPRRTTRTTTTGRRPTSYPDDYADRLLRALQTELGDELGRRIYSRVDNALKAYASARDNSVAGLLVRSYARQWSGDEDANRERMDLGVRYPGSLSVIVWNITDEYDTRSLQIYAIAEIFSINRWEAEIVLNMVIGNKI
ncbi:MAG: hypothetical protein KDK34_09715, partial [Leptospiraceae bacterium]|nr:hypothetical protein [Leptospiraceae bacterium]